MTRKLANSQPSALVTSLDSTEPTCFSQANQHPNWLQAMSNEIDALLSNGTWSLVPKTSNMNIVGCKWVFKIKRREDGQIDLYKAWLGAKGYHQEEGLDYSETFSPVVKPTIIRVILSSAVSQSWKIKQLEVNNAFLHGTLSETMFMVQPPGFEDSSHPTHVCKLHRSLYGLKQAPRAWYQRLSHFLIHLGFVNSRSNASLFL